MEELSLSNLNADTLAIKNNRTIVSFKKTVSCLCHRRNTHMNRFGNNKRELPEMLGSLALTSFNGKPST